MIEKFLTNIRLKNILLGVFLILLSISYIGSAVAVYESNKTNLYKNIDTTLYQGATLIDLILAKEFHNRATKSESISPDEDLENIKKLSQLAQNLNIAYLYSMVQDGDEIYFTSSSATLEDFEEKKVTRYYDKYNFATPSLQKLLENDTIVYEESTDRWGTFRSVLIPMTTDQGKRYILGADIQIDAIEEELDEILQEIVFFILLFIIVLCIVLFWYSFLLKKEFNDIKTIQKTLQEEIKNKTEDIQELLDQFTVASDYALAGYWNINLQTNEIFFSPGWYRFLGYDEERFKTLSTQETMEYLVHPEQYSYVLQKIEDVVADPLEEFSVDFRILNNNGEYVWIKSVGKIYRNKFFGFNIDIDDLYNTRRLLVQQSKLAEMGSMLENIAHQWRQPLNAISIVSGTVALESELGVLKEEALQKQMGYVEKNVQYLSETIDTFRNFVNSKKEYQNVCLQEKIDEVLHIVSGTLHYHNIKVIDTTPRENPITLDLAEGELAQVLINIINNAKDALIGKEIENPWVKIGLKQDESFVTITIEDNAKGIESENIEKIFDPYFTTKHKSQGTGLGLHMSYKIVTQSLKGKLYVKNSYYGAKFYIQIPLT